MNVNPKKKNEGLKEYIEESVTNVFETYYQEYKVHHNILNRYSKKDVEVLPSKLDLFRYEAIFDARSNLIPYGKRVVV